MQCRSPCRRTGKWPSPSYRSSSPMTTASAATARHSTRRSPFMVDYCAEGRVSQHCHSNSGCVRQQSPGVSSGGLNVAACAAWQPRCARRASWSGQNSFYPEVHRVHRAASRRTLPDTAVSAPFLRTWPCREARGEVAQRFIARNATTPGLWRALTAPRLTHCSGMGQGQWTGVV